MSILRSAAAALLLLVVAAQAACALASSAPPRQQRPPSELSSTVTISATSEMERLINGDPLSHCSRSLRRAAEVGGGRKVSIAITHYWADPSDLPPPGRRQGAATTCDAVAWARNSTVHHFCHRWDLGPDSTCGRFDSYVLLEFAQAVEECLREAVELFDVVLLAPRLMSAWAAGGASRVRNTLVFDPLAPDRYGYSYWDVMLAPLLKAANHALDAALSPGAGADGDSATAPPKKKALWFGLQGGMGASAFAFPDSYVEAARRLRSGWRAPAAAAAELKVGVLLNHGYAAGVINRGPGPRRAALPSTSESESGGFLDGAWGALLPFERWPRHRELKVAAPGLRRLFDTVDFVGVSNYARAASPRPTPADMESGVRQLDAELTATLGDAAGSLRALLLVPPRSNAANGGGKFLIWSEFGLGGGASACGDAAAATGAAAGLFPWLGVTTGYRRATDPWKTYLGQKGSKAVAAPVRDYMRAYYAAALALLKGGGSARFPVTAAFLRSTDSWDVQGVDPTSSSSAQGSYYEPGASRLIREHNEAVGGGPRPSLPPPPTGGVRGAAAAAVPKKSAKVAARG